MKQLDNEQFLGAIRSGSYTEWDQLEFAEELRRPERIDGLRPHVRAEDLSLVLRLVGSDKADEVLIAHVIGRKLMREMPERVAASFSAAYERWRTKGNLFLAVSLFHDLAEQPEFLQPHREDFVRLVEADPLAVKSVITSFVGDDTGFLRVFSHRLQDVFSDSPQTLNNPGKAFMYVLYLGLISDPPIRAAAAQVLREYQMRGDVFFQELTKRTLGRLAETRASIS